MSETMDVLPGEGEVKVERRVHKRRMCDICGEPAHFKHTFLLEGARSNRASSAYGKDDCSWCEDDSVFSCREHKNESRSAQDGYSWCSTFPANARFAHMFLYWEAE